jgi:hypothetical protein
MAAIASARIEITCSVDGLTEPDLLMWMQNAIGVAVDGFTDNYPRKIIGVHVATRVPARDWRLPVNSLP